MNANRSTKGITTLLGLLSAAALLGAPNAAQADQGKWWNPKQREVREVKAPVRHESYRPPAWRGARQVYAAPRYHRAWRGYRVYRDRVWVDSHRGYYGRPVYGWRYYAAPTYYYPGRICYVRPLRFFISADAVIGGVSVHAGYADPGPIYGCNFCDAQFHSYHAYEAHVAHCDDAPSGYRVVAHDWESAGWDAQGARADGDWSREDED